MKAEEYLINYLETETDFYKNDKVGGYGIMKADNFASVMQQFANQRVIEELEFQAKHLAENDSVDDAIADINRRIKELKQTI